jgi:hypothetical protein
VASAPHLTYRQLLETVAKQGYLVVATPFINTFDHRAIAQEVHITFGQALHYLQNRVLQGREATDLWHRPQHGLQGTFAAE